MRRTKALLKPLGGPVSESTGWATMHLAGRQSRIRFESCDSGESFYGFYLTDPAPSHEVGAPQFGTLFEASGGRVAGKADISEPGPGS